MAKLEVNIFSISELGRKTWHSDAYNQGEMKSGKNYHILKALKVRNGGEAKYTDDERRR